MRYIIITELVKQFFDSHVCGCLPYYPGKQVPGKTILDFTEARLGYMQVCTSLQTDNHASTPPLSFFTGWMPFLPPNQQHQSTEGSSTEKRCK